MNIGIDVSHLVHTDYIAGPQRVTLTVMDEFYRLSKTQNFKIYAINVSGREISSSKKEISGHHLLISAGDDLHNMDILLLLDGNNHHIVESINKKKFKGVVISVLHDVLPLSNPEWYTFSNRPHYLQEYVFYLMRLKRVSNVVITPSHQNRNDVLEQFDNILPSELKVIPFGAFRRNKGIVQLSDKMGVKNLVCVNTIEPKKGHNDILDAFDYLIEHDLTLRLTLIGKEGWNSKDIIQRIVQHEQFQKRLYWFDSLNDEQVESVYRSSELAINASRAEGFGLTIEEGLNHGLKVVCRDIPVFRERRNGNIHFFSGGGIDLAKAIWGAMGAQYLLNEYVRSMEEFAKDLLQEIRSMKNTKG